VEPEKKKTVSNRRGLLDAALEIGRKRHDILQRMRAAVEAGNRSEVFEIARELCGVNQDEQARN
jgi:hypothetical protein